MLCSLPTVRASGDVFDWSRRFLVTGTVACLHRDQFWDTDQVIGDQIEYEVGGDATDAAMFCLAHRTVLLAPTEDTFDHRAPRLRHAIAFVPRGAFVDGALATFAGFGDAIVLCHMRRDVAGAKIGHMIGRHRPCLHRL